jgi:hypothetical protein
MNRSLLLIRRADLLLLREQILYCKLQFWLNAQLATAPCQPRTRKKTRLSC